MLTKKQEKEKEKTKMIAHYEDFHLKKKQIELFIKFQETHIINEEEPYNKFGHKIHEKYEFWTAYYMEFI